MNDENKETEEITELSKRAASANNSNDSLKFSQAALNLANVSSIFFYLKRDRESYKS